MKDPYLLHIFNPTKNVSPFDVNMAYEASFDGVIPYSEVTLEDVRNLTQDTIFSRGPSGVKRTGIFIGGREFGLAIDMLHRARAAMVPPFEVSVFVDPSGAITTAAALVACVEFWLQKKWHTELEGKNVYIFGGTGPVGICAGILAAKCGARVFLGSHLGKRISDEVADEYNKRFGVTMEGEDNSSNSTIHRMVESADVVMNTAKAGIQILSREHLEHAGKMMVAADVNAVPPLGIEGVEVNDMGRELTFTQTKALAIGALAIGNIKYQVHHRMFELMMTASKPVYLDHEEAFAAARVITAENVR